MYRQQRSGSSAVKASPYRPSGAGSGSPRPASLPVPGVASVTGWHLLTLVYGLPVLPRPSDEASSRRVLVTRCARVRRQVAGRLYTHRPRGPGGPGDRTLTTPVPTAQDAAGRSPISVPHPRSNRVDHAAGCWSVCIGTGHSVGPDRVPTVGFARIGLWVGGTCLVDKALDGRVLTHSDRRGGRWGWPGGWIESRCRWGACGSVDWAASGSSTAGGWPRVGAGGQRRRVRPRPLGRDWPGVLGAMSTSS